MLRWLPPSCADAAPADPSDSVACVLAHEHKGDDETVRGTYGVLSVAHWQYIAHLLKRWALRRAWTRRMPYRRAIGAPTCACPGGLHGEMIVQWLKDIPARLCCITPTLL